MKDFKLVPQGETEIVMTRTFDAPRALVFDALTKPEYVQRWLLGPSGWSMPVCEIDLKPGGRYRYVWRKDSDGTEMGVSGTYREIVPPERIVHTEQFDQPWYPGEAVITTLLMEEGGKTKFSSTMTMASRQARDGVLASGMESGVVQSYDRMEELLLQAV